jgi:hypothetical protein
MLGHVKMRLSNFRDWRSSEEYNNVGCSMGEFKVYAV